MGQYAWINGNVLNGTKDMKPEKATVLIDGDRITDIISSGVIPDGYEIIDLKNKYLLPGLINMHAHLPGSGKPQKKQRDNAKLVST
ncbi:MAG: amidohydrolase family protein, partial [Erysipelotrichia bacterium]|nr:amidohydrolase family protein [Erysipelotrichia bacterium]